MWRAAPCATWVARPGDIGLRLAVSVTAAIVRAFPESPMSPSSPRPFRLVLLLSGSVACTDYNFHGEKDPEPGGEDSAPLVTTDDPGDSGPSDDSGDPPVDDT